MEKERSGEESARTKSKKQISLGFAKIHSNLESGKQNPTLETIKKIAKALGVKIDDIVK